MEGKEDIDIDQIIGKLLKVKAKDRCLSEAEVRYLCTKVRPIFLDQPVLLELNAPIKVCGSIFGHYEDLLRIFNLGGPPPESNYLFLGNYVDKGRHSLDTICLLFAYKIKYPENFFLLRGNHECSWINRLYGFSDECKLRFNIKLWKMFNDVFNCLPIAAIIDNKIFCVHSGLSPELTSLDQITEITRPTDVPDTGLLLDLLWADPDRDTEGWYDPGKAVSYCFGTDIVENFLIQHDFNLICRSHQVVEDGYEFLADKGFVTLFSASNYCGEFDNSAAMMSIDESLRCSFETFQIKMKTKS